MEGKNYCFKIEVRLPTNSTVLKPIQTEVKGSLSNGHQSCLFLVQTKNRKRERSKLWRYAVSRQLTPHLPSHLRKTPCTTHCFSPLTGSNLWPAWPSSLQLPRPTHLQGLWFPQNFLQRRLTHFTLYQASLSLKQTNLPKYFGDSPEIITDKHVWWKKYKAHHDYRFKKAFQWEIKITADM